MKPTLGFGDRCGLANALFNLEFNEIPGAAATKDERQSKGGHGGEDG